MTIAAHSQIAEYYSFRPPYIEPFLRGAAQKLGIDRDTVLLDLCCGRGELAAGFADSCKAIYAIDGSAEMLQHRIAKPNVNFLLHDVNAEQVTLPQQADHFVVGSAIHWIEPASLARWMERNLKPGGKVLVAHPLMKVEDQPWHPALVRIGAQFGRGGPGRSFAELRGEATLRACGYASVDSLRIARRVQFDLEYLYRQQLAYMYSDFYHQVVADMAAFRKAFMDALAPFVPADGKLTGQLVNWGVIYGRSPEGTQ